MSKRELDARYRKSEERLLKSLVVLAAGNHTVKVCDLCARAGVFQSTFYRHYHSIQDLIFQKENAILQQFDQLVLADQRRHADLPQVFEDTLIFIYKNREDLRLLASLDQDKIPLALMQKLKVFTTAHWGRKSPLIYGVYSHEAVAILDVWEQQENFSIDNLEQHERELLYLTNTAIRRLGHLAYV